MVGAVGFEPAILAVVGIFFGPTGNVVFVKLAIAAMYFDTTL